MIITMDKIYQYRSNCFQVIGMVRLCKKFGTAFMQLRSENEKAVGPFNVDTFDFKWPTNRPGIDVIPDAHGKIEPKLLKQQNHLFFQFRIFFWVSTIGVSQHPGKRNPIEAEGFTAVLQVFLHVDRGKVTIAPM